MATNSDGSIVLSVEIETDNLKTQINNLGSFVKKLVGYIDTTSESTAKLNNEIAKSQILEEKVKQEQEKTAQAVEKTYQAIEKTNQAKLKTSQLDDKTILSAEKVAQAELKTQQQAERLNAEKAKTSQETMKISQEEAKAYREVFNTISARERLNQEIEKTSQQIEFTKQAEESTRQSFEKTTQAQEKTTQATEKTRQAQEKTRREVDKTRNTTEKATTAADKLALSMKKVASALGIIYSIRQIVQFSNEASKLAAQAGANIQRLSSLYGESAQYVKDFADANAYAFGMSKTAAYQAAADYGNLFTTFANGAESAKLTIEMLQATAVIASKTGRTYEDVFEKIRSGLYGQTRAIDDLGLSVRQASLMQTQAYQTVSGGVKKWNELTDAELQQIRALAIVEQSHIKYGNTVLQTTALVRSQFNAAWQDFKATWGQVVNLVLIPVLTIATQILATITSILQKIFSLTGKQNKETKKVSDTIGIASSNQKDLSDNISSANKGLKETNKELRKEIANFDELDILSRNNIDNMSGGAGGVSGGGATTSAGDLGGGGDGLPDKGEIDGKLAAFAVLAGAALVGLGVILMCTGHVLLGIGMVALGAVTIWSAAKWSDLNLDKETKEKLGKAIAIVGLVAFVLGVILMFIPGCLFIGFGFMAAGAAAIYGARALTGFSADLEGFIAACIALVGLTAFILGVILLFVPDCMYFGLMFMAVGVALVIGETFLSEDAIKEKMKEYGNKFWAAIMIMAALMVCIGIVLCFTEQYLPGISLIVGGIVTLVSEIYLSHEYIKKKLEELCKKYWEALLLIGVIMVAVGIACLFVETLVGVGVSLIALGITDLVTTTAFAWDAIKEALKAEADKFHDWVKKYNILLTLLGIIMLFIPVPGMIPIGLGLIVEAGNTFGTDDKELSFSSFGDELVKQLEGVYDAISPILKKIGNAFSNAFGGKKNIDINVKNKKSGGSSPKQMASAQSVQYKVPALASGRVLPANKPFLAVVGDQKRGTNIEAPADLIKQKAMEAIIEANASIQPQQQVREEHYYLDQTELMSIVYKLFKGGERLNGQSLINSTGGLL